MIRTLFLLGPSDAQEDLRAASVTRQDGRRMMTAEFHGILPISPFIMEDRVLNANSRLVMVGVNRIQLRGNERLNLFNLVGDADSSTRALHAIQTVANKVRPKRLFNQPSDVFKTSRARLPNTLAGVPGCRVARVESCDAKSAEELKSSCERFGCWPVILRTRGEHGGQNMLVLDEITQLEGVSDLTWLYDGIFLIEFIDFRRSDHLYQKNRVIVVDGLPYPRHAIFSEHWKVQAGSRKELMIDDLALCREEERFLAEGLKGFERVFKEMYQRIGLDIFGVDFAIVDGELLVFEANACMKFLDRKHREDGRFNYLNKHVKELKRAIKQMLVKA